MVFIIFVIFIHCGHRFLVIITTGIASGILYKKKGL